MVSKSDIVKEMRILFDYLSDRYEELRIDTSRDVNGSREKFLNLYGYYVRHHEALIDGNWSDVRMKTDVDEIVVEVSYDRLRFMNAEPAKSVEALLIDVDRLFECTTLLFDIDEKGVVIVG